MSSMHEGRKKEKVGGGGGGGEKEREKGSQREVREGGRSVGRVRVEIEMVLRGVRRAVGVK